MPEPHSVDAYVRAALKLQGYEFDEAAIARIAAQFERIAAVAEGVLALALPEHAGAAAVFRP